MVASRGFGESAYLRKFAGQLVADSPGMICDAPCGAGRNALYLASLHKDVRVMGVDADPAALEKLEALSVEKGLVERLCTRRMDLFSQLDDLKSEPIGAIVHVDWIAPGELLDFSKLLRRGGLLFVETFKNRGGNYLALPAAGAYRNLLMGNFELLFYEEKKAGPAHVDAVSVVVLAKRK